MIHGSLFTGIGGFDLAAEWMGWTNSFQCEIDPFCQKVLAKNFPDADRHTDIKGFDARRYRGAVDVLSGGFPCQPFSLAGQRRGNSDDRALWPQMLRIIDEVRPRWIVGENVAGLVSLGLDGVLFDLEASGYSVETVLLPACGVGAPHRRDRLWIIAHAGCESGDRREADQPGNGIGYRPDTRREETANQLAGPHEAAAAHADNQRCQERHTTGVAAQPGRTGGLNPTGRTDADPARQMRQWFEDATEQARRPEPATESWRLTEPPLCGPNDGLPAGLVRVSTRAKQLKAYGNSIVPQVAYEIFKAIALVDEA